MSITFNMEALADPQFDLTAELGTAPQLRVFIEGDVDGTCTLHAGDQRFSCEEVKAKNPFIIAHPPNEGGDVVLSAPYDIFIDNGNEVSAKVEVRSNPAGANPGAGDRTLSTKVDIDGPPIVWRDARLIRQAIDQGKSEVIEAVLSKYFPGPFDYDNARTTNGYLEHVLPASLEQLTATDNDGSDIGATSGLDLPIFNPNEALVALADLIVQRLIDELNVAYLDKFRADFNSSGLARLLPNTGQILTGIGSTYSVNYKMLLPSLREALDEDLQKLPGNGRQLLYERRSDFLQLSGVTPDDYVLLLTCLQVIDESLHLETMHPEAILDRLLQTDYGLPSGHHSDLESMIKFVALVSNHFREGPSSGRWIDHTSIQNFLQEPSHLYLFIGLLMELEKSSLQNLQINNGSIYDALQGDKGYAFVRLTGDFIAYVLEMKKLSEQFNPDVTDEQKMAAVYDLVTQTLNLLSDLPPELWPSGREPEWVLVVRDIRAIMEHINRREYVAAVAILSRHLELPGLDQELYDTLFKYISFVQALINAKDADEILTALDQAADPVGSYRHKRSYPMTVSLSAYPGLGLGREQFVEGINADRVVNNVGFTAPFGLAVSFSGASGPDDNKASWTFFAPILDVGAIASARLLDSMAVLPEFSWENFLAPGLVIQHGCKNSPLSIHFGVQYSPQVRRITPTLMEQDRLLRFNAGISVDLHLFSVYNRPKKE